ncbi:MAG: pitrilysin family protein [bacterium]|nr:pitrilysin family protein [bacterium]
MSSKTALTMPKVPGVSFVRTRDGIHEFRLDKNGLQILLAPDHSVPVAGIMVTYRVGSRNEAIGYTGATHLLEHLMFKGSDNFNKKRGGTIWEILETKGALVNATTWNDRTNYYEVLPNEHLPIAIALEADRMRSAHLKDEDKASEMPVVRNEFERGENLPMEAIDKQLWALAYEAHPYHHSTIGWRSDIERVPIERLKQFYDDFYHPDNATISIVGSFDDEATLASIAKEFGKHKKSPSPLPAMYTEEPKQEGERRATVNRAGNTNMVALAHKIPAASDADTPAILLLALILGDGKTSRLYRALVDASKATSVTTMCYQFRDPSLLISYITLTPKTRHDAVEKLAKQEFKKIIEKGVTSAELLRAKRSMRAYRAARRDGPYALLSSLNEEIATGDWTRFVTLPDLISRQSAKDVQRVAKKYLVDDQSTIGYFVGTDS